MAQICQADSVMTGDREGPVAAVAPFFHILGLVLILLLWLKRGGTIVALPRFDLEHADGYLYVVDRAKELIKYNAYQIAPAELEAVLVSHPAVAEAAVIPSPDIEHGEVPKAFVVLKTTATAEELMEFVAGRVASYKKVRKLVIVDTIPKSPAGKLLRRVLVEQDRIAPG